MQIGLNRSRKWEREIVLSAADKKGPTLILKLQSLIKIAQALRCLLEGEAGGSKNDWIGTLKPESGRFYDNILTRSLGAKISWPKQEFKFHFWDSNHLNDE